MTPDDSTWATVFTDPIRLTVLNLLHRLGVADVRELAARAHTSDRTLRRHLEALVALGLVHQVDPERNSLRPGRPGIQFLIDPQAQEDLTRLFAILRSPDS